MNILKYLFTAEGATYAATLVVLAAGWLATWLQSRRSRRVAVTLVSQTPQVTISERVRKNLGVSYKGIVVDQLVLTRLHITNEGIGDLNEVEILLTFTARNPETDPNKWGLFVEIEIDDPLNRTQHELGSETLANSAINFKQWTAKIRRPFLNAKRAYPEEKIKITLFSNAEMDISVSGGGQGWYAQFKRLDLIALKWFNQIFGAIAIVSILSLLANLTVNILVPATQPWSILTMPVLLGLAGSSLYNLYNIRRPGKLQELFSLDER